LFVDEIHRFNKGQQDAFLPHVEDGTLLLVGATTENPSFSLNAALLSRCRVVPLAALSAADLVPLLERALVDPRAAWVAPPPAFALEALALIAEHADGDARRALGDLELVAQAAPSTPLGGLVTPEVTATLIGARVLRGDKTGDSQFDLASALIKSLRASDPDAALYYAARLLEGGEDPRFVLRRLVIFASEDVGNADPRALGVAVDATVGFERIGMPEGRILIGQAVTYLATAPKSNAAYLAIDKALEAVRRTGVLPVPLHLRNAPTKLMQALGHGAGYQYPHDHGGFVPGEHLPEALRGTVFYAPSGDGYEKQIAERLARWRAARDAGGGGAE
jgi:putative ATPase